MAVAQGPLLVAVLLLVSSGLHCFSSSTECPESCTCQRASLLNCSSSGLSLVPQHIQHSVTELDLSHNILLSSVALSWPYHNLRNVWLGNNTITHLSLCIEGNPRRKFVRDAQLRRLSRRCVSWAPTLQLLSVERNQLEQLPEGLEGSKSLQVLQLSFNRISTLRPGDLSHLQQLKELHLQHNLIASLHSQMFQDLAQLRVLDLSFNMLTSLHPFMYLSLHNIGADVKLDGNRWKCDCSMRNLRRRMAYDGSRGLQTWSIMCASPSIHSGKDLLQLEENDLNCFSAENSPELHLDLTVNSGSEILLSCSTQDSLWWTPSGQSSVSQPQAGLLISDITERKTGLYVCVSEEHEVVSVFNLQITKIRGTRRHTRSLPRRSQQILPQDTANRIAQESNRRTTKADLTLAVCLSVFITFLVAFILGVLARPCIDVLWKRVTNKKRSSAANSVSSVEQREYDNEAFSIGEEPGEIPTHRERRVTFSTVDFREDNNVIYYDTIANDDQESINNDAVIECEMAEEVKHSAGDSGSENNLRQTITEDNQKNGRDLPHVTNSGCTHNIEFEHIPDPVELEEQGSLSSSSDSSISDKVLKEDQMTQGGCTKPKSSQLAEDSVQQRPDFSTATKEVPQMSTDSINEIPGFDSEPFAKWSPHSNNTHLADLDLWQENEEQFEFSDSVRSTPSSMFGSLNDVATTPHKQKRDDMSSSSSYVSEDEPTQYTVNSDQEKEEGDTRDKVNLDLGYITHTKRRLDIRAPSPASDSSSSSDSENETTHHTDRPGKVNIVELSLQKSQKISDDSETQWPAVDLGNITRIKRRLDIKGPSPPPDSKLSSESRTDRVGQREEASKISPYYSSDSSDEQEEDKTPSPASDSSSSSWDSEDETTGRTEKQRPVKESQTVSHDPDARWPTIDLQHIPCIKRRLDIKGPSPPSDSSSNHEILEDKIPQIITKRPFEDFEAESHDPERRWPDLDLEHTTRIKRRVDIKAPIQDSDSSSSSDSEDETTHHIKKQEQGEIYVAKLPVTTSQRRDQDTQWPVVDFEHTTPIKRRLDIRAPSPASDSSSSSDSENETTHHTDRPGKVNIVELSLQKPQKISDDSETQWPAVDLGNITRIKRRLDIKGPSPPPDSKLSSESRTDRVGQREEASKISPYYSSDSSDEQEEDKTPSPASDSSSSSWDSEDETTGRTEKQRPVKESQTVSHDPDARWPTIDLQHIPCIKRRLDIKGPSPPSDSSSNHKILEDKIPQIITKRPFEDFEAESHDPERRWPALDLEHTTRIKRRVDIKAPIQDSDSSSSSDSEDETTHHIKKQEQGEIYVAKLPVTTSQRRDQDTQWPVVDFEHTTPIKRRLDIRAPSPASDSSSSSDSENETTHHTDRPGKVNIVELSLQKSQKISDDSETQWPAVDLGNITRIKRRLDIKGPSPPPDSKLSSESRTDRVGQREEASKISPYYSSDSSDEQEEDKTPSPASDSSSSSWDSEDETTGRTEKQRPVKESRTVSHDPDARWPTIDLQHIPCIKRRLDIKGPSPPSNSSLYSDSENEATHYIKKQEQGEIYMANLLVKTSQRHEQDTQWPVVDFEHTTPIKRRLDIRASSPASDSSASSDSENETADNTEKQRPAKLDIVEIPLNDPDTRWPALDLKHLPHIKKRLNIKALPPYPDLASNIELVEDKISQIQKNEQSEVHITQLPFQSETESHDQEPKLPALDLEQIIHIKRRLDIKAPSQDSDSSSSSDSEDETMHCTERPLKVNTVELPLQKCQTVSDDPEARWPAVDLGTITHIKRRLDIKGPSPPPDSLTGESRTNRIGQREEASKISPYYSSSSSDEQEEGMEKLNSLPIKVVPDPDPRWPEFDLSIKLPKNPILNISCSPKTDHTIKLEKYTVITDNLGEIPSDNSRTTPEINPELQSRWATMNLGVSRFRKRLEITSHKLPFSARIEHDGKGLSGTTESPVVIDNESSQNRTFKSETEEAKKMARVEFNSETPKVAVESDSMWPHLSLTNIPIVKRALDIRAPSQTESLSSSNSKDEKIHHSVPDLSIGVPRIKRRMNIKAPSPEHSDSSSSCSENENELVRYTAKESGYASNMAGMTDNDSPITYKRLIMKTSSPPSNYFSPSGKSQTVAQDGSSQRDKKTSLVERGLLSLSFNDVFKKKVDQSRCTADGDLPPEIRWTGIGRHLSDLSSSRSRRHLDVDLSPQPSPEQPERAPTDSSNFSSIKSHSNIKQDTGKEFVTPGHSYSALSALESSRAFDNFENSTGNTNNILRGFSQERRERKGLSALKAMSSERQKWDTGDPQGDTSFNYRKSEEDIKPLATQPLTQLHFTSTSLGGRRAADVLYGIPHYKRHDTGDTEPPKEVPPPVPATPPPDEVVELTRASHKGTS